MISGCVNGSGTLKVRTTKEFDDSTVAKILELVENAGSKKAKMENFITRFAKYYTPVVTIGAVVLAVLPPLILGGGWGSWIQRACIFLVISCVVNVVLDFLFVPGLDMGVAGAAWATVISQLIAMAGSVWYGVRKNPYLKLQRSHRRFEREIFSKSVRLGIPLAAQNALIALSCVALQSVVNQFGSVAMAAYTATGRVEQLVQQPFGSLGTAVSTFAGQNAGAGKYDRVSRGCRKSVLLVVCFSVVMIAVMFLLGEQIIGLFVSDAEVIAIGARGLQITSIMYVALGLIYVMRGMLNGVGDAAFAMINGVTEVIGRIGFAWVLMMIPSIGMWGIWYTNGLTWALTGLANVYRFLQGRWKLKCVVECGEKDKDRCREAVERNA